MKFLYTFWFIFTGLLLNAQHTFSIVAVDTLTGEVGSAGASCLDNIQFPGSGGAIIISDLVPGMGAVHTQAYYNAVNQANARLRMKAGDTPDQILQYVKSKDPEGLFGWQKRQYGVVRFDANGKAVSAGHTGNFTENWKGHKTGKTYSIQGNILLGAQILDSMEARFLNTSGPLADRLMAALQGANVPGADTRCLNNGTSSLSAFLRVAKPADSDSLFYLDLNVPSLPAGQEPIDSLQTLYSKWKLTAAYNPTVPTFSIYPNPARDHIFITLESASVPMTIYNIWGEPVFSVNLSTGVNLVKPVFQKGIYYVKIGTLMRKIVWMGN